MEQQVRDAVGAGAADFLNATRLASVLTGDALMTNMFLLGVAYQKGRVPVSSAALLRPIELNAVAVEGNKQAFLWGRRAAFDPEGVEQLVRQHEPVLPAHRLSRDLDEAVARRRDYLWAYQDRAYARRYTELVGRVRRAENALLPGSALLTEAVARGYFKLLAYKDEYEVARLYTDPEFALALGSAFEGAFKLRFHLAIPALSRPDPVTGEPKKRSYGPWLISAFRLLAPLKFLRGTPLDIFGYGAERRRNAADSDCEPRWTCLATPLVMRCVGRGDRACPKPFALRPGQGAQRHRHSHPAGGVEQAIKDRKTGK